MKLVILLTKDGCALPSLRVIYVNNIPELILVIPLLNKKVYLQYFESVDISYIKDTYKELYYLYRILFLLHKQNPDVEQLSLDELSAAFWQKYPEAQKENYENIFKQLYSLSISNDVGVSLLRDIKRRKALLKLSESAYIVANGTKDVDLRAMLQEMDEEVDHQRHTPVSTDLDLVLSNTVSKPGLRWRLGCLNSSMGSLRKGDFGYIFARPECISGDSVIRVGWDNSSKSSKQYTIAQFYKTFNGNHWLKGNGHRIQACTPEGSVYYTDIEHVTYSGRKKVWKVSTLRGFSLKTTLDHEFLLPDGNYVQLKDLAVGSEIRSDRTEKANRRVRSEMSGRWPGSPYAERMVGPYGPYHRAKTHRIAYDAGLNYIDIPTFIQMLSDGKAKDLVFSDQSLDVHHLDMDHDNNAFNNLKLVTREEHTAYHARACHVGNSHYADVDVITSITYVGEEDTYDLGVAGPNKNFKANGIYVHNCGKTAFLVSEGAHMLSQCPSPMLHFNNEEEDNKVVLRYYQGYFGITLEQLLANPKQWRDRFKEEVGDKLAFFGIEYCNKADMEAIFKEYSPSLAVIDQLSKVKGFAADRDDLKLGAAFQWARELAKEYCPVIGVHQADGSAEGVKYLTMDHCANAKTAIQAEADWIVGIGKTNEIGADEVRYLSICKNKLLGDQDSDPNLRHARFEVLLKAQKMQYQDIVSYA